MLFLHPGALYRFDVPDDWLATAEVQAFAPTSRCYAWLPEPLWPVTVVDVQRLGQRPGEAIQLERERMVHVLQAMVRQQPLAALPGSQDPHSGHILLHGGTHRLHAALVLRYRQVPVVLMPSLAL